MSHWNWKVVRYSPWFPRPRGYRPLRLAIQKRPEIPSIRSIPSFRRWPESRGGGPVRSYGSPAHAGIDPMTSLLRRPPLTAGPSGWGCFSRDSAYWARSIWGFRSGSRLRAPASSTATGARRWCSLPAPPPPWAALACFLDEGEVMKLRKYIPNLDKPLQSESAHPQWLRRWQVAGVLVAMAWAVVYLALLALSNPFPRSARSGSRWAGWRWAGSAAPWAPGWIDNRMWAQAAAMTGLSHWGRLMNWNSSSSRDGTRAGAGGW